jgi:protein involved in polysaccharide export with SLBB domain
MVQGGLAVAIRGVMNTHLRSMGFLVAFLPVVLFGLAEQAHAQAGQTVLRTGDILRINVWPNTELGGEFTIEEDGYVYLPLLAEVPAAGVSVDDLRVELRRRYSEVQRNPVVTVTPMFRVSVTGGVQRPGIHTITPNTSLLDVVVMSGGFQGSADSENVRIVRPGQVTDYDAMRALETGEGMEAITLQSGDHIVVPMRSAPWLTARNAFEVVRTASTLLLIWDRFFRNNP